jgi:hypothetical protein
MTITRAASSAAAFATAACAASHNGCVMAFDSAGRLSESVATPSSIRMRTSSSVGVSPIAFPPAPDSQL